MQQTNLSPRAKLALGVLASGGRFVMRLERNGYTGRSQFKTRLVDYSSGQAATVRGISGATFHELDRADFVQITGEGTSVSTYYKIRDQA